LGAHSHQDAITTGAVTASCGTAPGLFLHPDEAELPQELSHHNPHLRLPNRGLKLPGCAADGTVGARTAKTKRQRGGGGGCDLDGDYVVGSTMTRTRASDGWATFSWRYSNSWMWRGLSSIIAPK